MFTRAHCHSGESSPFFCFMFLSVVSCVAAYMWPSWLCVAQTHCYAVSIKSSQQACSAWIWICYTSMVKVTINFNNILPSGLYSSFPSAFFRILRQNLYTFLISTVQATCLTQPLWYDPPVTSPILGPDILLSTIFGQSSFLYIGDQISLPWRIISRVFILKSSCL